MTLIAPGKCRHCGCTEDNPCRLEDNENCCWMDADRIVCSRPACQIAEDARKAKAKAAAAPPRRKNSAEIFQEQQARRKRARRLYRAAKKGRAA